ncbi:DUF262 domain-containing protein [Nitratiruptor tergarcus]|uniref:DUF262 domain-containing protein n=1 Tax=Nitratiruptor tergarcus TaxID=269259 RepID=UPI0009FDF63C|nr:DUF262 domain-containing protein [Nitratiruptor tergarcus]
MECNEETLDKVYFSKKEYKLLKEYKFEIPLYQRPYAWKTEEVETLLNDILENKDQDYFLGTLVVDAIKSNKYELIDGQQRLTTLYLIAVIFGYRDAIDIDYQIREEDNHFLKILKSLPDESFQESSLNLTLIAKKRIIVRLR